MPEEDSFEEIMVKGEKKMLLGEFSAAIGYYEKALNLFPEEGLPLIKLSEATFELMSTNDRFDAQALNKNIERLETANALITSGKSKYHIDIYNGLSDLHHQKARNYLMLDNFSESHREFEEALKIEPEKEESKKGLQGTKELLERTKSKSKSCFVATAIYGAQYSYEVQCLLRFRDHCLSKTIAGKLFIKYYYELGPLFARIVNRHLLLKNIIKKILFDPAIKFLSFFEPHKSIRI